MTAASLAQLTPALVGFFGAAYIMHYSVKELKVLGGTQPKDMKTLQPKWKGEVALRLQNMEREGAPEKPILLNPFRNNVPASIRNRADMEAL